MHLTTTVNFQKNFTDVRKNLKKKLKIWSKVSHYQAEFMMLLQFNHFFNYLIILKIPIWAYSVQAWPCILQMWACLVQVWSCILQVWACLVQVWSCIMQVWACSVQAWSCMLQVWAYLQLAHLMQVWCRYVHAEYRHAAHLLQTWILHDFTMIRYDYGQKVRYGTAVIKVPTYK